MLETFTVSDLIADIRASTDHDSDEQVTDAQLIVWIRGRYKKLRRRLGDLVPDLFTKITADFTITAGNSSFDLSTSPTSVADMGKLLVVEKKTGADYTPLSLAPIMTADVIPYLSFRQRGNATVDIFPKPAAPATYRAKYIGNGSPGAVTATDSTLELPEEAGDVLAQDVCARVRVRFEEDPSPHYENTPDGRREPLGWAELRDGLCRLYPATPQTIAVVRGRRW
jgi:hypothetical protein